MRRSVSCCSRLSRSRPLSSSSSRVLAAAAAASSSSSSSLSSRPHVAACGGARRVASSSGSSSSTMPDGDVPPRIPGSIINYPHPWQPKIDADGRFQLPWAGFQLPKPQVILDWQFGRTPRSSPGVPKDPAELDRTLPILQPDLKKYGTSHGIHMTWLGHASVLIRLHGFTVLTDPVLGERASPMPWFGGTPRYRASPLSVAQLPRVDAVVISHSHYDHLDLLTVRELEATQRPLWYVPKGLKQWMLASLSGGVRDADRVVELSWWQEHTPAHRSDAFVAFTPAQHWTRRTLTDMNRSLWGSYVVSVKGQKFWFSGDTGYFQPLFQEIGRVYGPVEVAAIPIGAYDPRTIMKPAHCNPQEAVAIHRDIKAKRSFGIHWGTMVVTDEPYLEPRELLARHRAEAGLAEHDFWAPVHGQTVTL